jgi:hypothetical protein
VVRYRSAPQCLVSGDPDETARQEPGERIFFKKRVSQGGFPCNGLRGSFAGIAGSFEVMEMYDGFIPGFASEVLVEYLQRREGGRMEQLPERGEGTGPAMASEMVAEELLIGLKFSAGGSYVHGHSLLPGCSGPDHLLIQEGYEGREVGEKMSIIFQSAWVFPENPLLQSMGSFISLMD